jgi:hypothetical protein
MTSKFAPFDDVLKTFLDTLATEYGHVEDRAGLHGF